MLTKKERKNEMNMLEKGNYSSGNLCFFVVGNIEEICCVDGCRGRRVRFLKEFRL